MEQQGEKKKFHKLLFVKTCFWFAVIMILFVVVLGFIYMRLYKQTIMNDYNNKSNRKQIKEIVPAWSQNWLLP